MGHIGGGGIDGYSQQAATRRPVRQRASSTQDPDINISPLMKRSDSFSSFTGQQTGSSKANLGAKSGSSNIVCKREAFYVVEVINHVSRVNVLSQYHLKAQCGSQIQYAVDPLLMPGSALAKLPQLQLCVCCNVASNAGL